MHSRPAAFHPATQRPRGRGPALLVGQYPGILPPRALRVGRLAALDANKTSGTRHKRSVPRATRIANPVRLPGSPRRRAAEGVQKTARVFGGRSGSTRHGHWIDRQHASTRIPLTIRSSAHRGKCARRRRASVHGVVCSTRLSLPAHPSERVIPLDGIVLPIDPVDGMSCEIRIHRVADRREERVFAETREESVALQLVLHGIFHLGEAEFDARVAQASSSSTSMSAAVTSTLVTGSAATTTQLTVVGDEADGARNAFVEQLCVREEQRRIPAEQHEARNLARVRDSG